MGRPKKIKFFKLTSFKNATGSKSWRVTGTKPDGTRVRKNFENKTDALKELGDLEEAVEAKPDGRHRLKTSLSQEELTDAEAAIRQLGGVSLSQAMGHYLALRDRASEKSASLDQAISFFETRYRPETKEITIFNAKKEYMDTRHDLTDATLGNYEVGLSLLVKKNPNASLHSFSVGDLELVLKKYKNRRTQRSFRVIFSVFFNWAVRHHYCLENPCHRFDKLRKDKSRISALSLDESKRLLYSAMKYRDGATAGAVAIGLFAGLRPSELKDLKEEDIRKEKIRIDGGKMRRQLKRSAPIPPVLAVWLEKYPFKGLPAGWDSAMKALKKATKAKKWVSDIVRHTSITFQTERDKNEALTAYNCGTSIQMMNRHYRDSVDDEEKVQEFWNLTPDKLEAEVPDVKLHKPTKIDWPDKDALTKLVWNKPLIHVAKDLGVSDVAVRRYCIRQGIELPKQGHWIRQSIKKA